MATDEVIYDSDRGYWPFGSVALHTSQYARLTDDRKIQVRGSAFSPDRWGYNWFRPEEARRLARYILELADDAEKDPAVEELAGEIGIIWQTYNGTCEQMAEELIKKGYRK